MRLRDKVALISGGAGDVGAATARLFCQQGASVVIGDVRVERGREVAAGIERAGGAAVFRRLDVTLAEDWKAAVEDTVRRLGRLDVLVNNAGIPGVETIERTAEEEWERILAVNAKGAFLGTREVLPVMRRQGGGSIVNVASLTAMVGTPRGGAYAASKGAVRALTRATAVQGAGDGIRANSLYPGPIETGMIAPGLRDEAAREAAIRRIPLGRLGTPLEVAHCALFLASDESAFVTGAELVVDGGVTAV